MNTIQAMKRTGLLKTLLVLPIALVLHVSPVQAAADTTLYFNPATTTVATDQQFSLDARVSPTTNAISAVEMHVTYDQTKFRLDSITASSAFSLELSAASINNTNGTASIALGVPLASPSVTTDTSVATFSFHSLAAVTGSSFVFTTASMASDDGAGGNALATLTPAAVTVTGSDTTAPTVSITSPSEGVTVYGTTTTVTASASDTIGVVGVQFKLDGVALGSEVTSAPYSIVWDTTQASDGAHALTAVARDAAGNSTTSTGVNVTVSNVTATGDDGSRDGDNDGDGGGDNDHRKNKNEGRKKIAYHVKKKAGENIAPFILIKAPKVGSRVTNNGKSLYIEAEARDASGIQSMIFSTDNKYRNKKVIGAQLKYIYSRNSGFGNGARSLYITAFDKLGNQKTIAINVQNKKVVSIQMVK